MTAPWKGRLQASVKKNASLAYSRYMQVATVRTDGTPAVRTVVFRGFLGETDNITFITDQRSNKIEEIAKNAAYEVAWYFPQSREQYRLTGTLAVVSASDPRPDMLAARQTAWDKLSDAARAQFSWPQPGLPRDPDSQFAREGAPTSQQPPLDPFSLVIMTIHAVDYINLYKNTRFTYTQKADGEWLEAEVNP